MISIEAYRSRIGSYCSTARRVTAQSQYFRLEKRMRAYKENDQHKHFWGEMLRFRFIFYFIVIVCLSVYTNYQQLLQDGDVESNPGPSQALKIIFGSFNQGDIFRFGETAGSQCGCNSLLAICWASIKRVSVWKTWDLDNVLESGDKLYKHIGIHRSLSLDELPHNVELYGHQVQVLKLKNEYGMISREDNTDFIQESMRNCEDTGNGVLFLTNGYTCAIIWSKQNYFLFDSHGHNKEGLMSGDGPSILLGFCCTDDLQKYIRRLYLCNVEETPYELQYIKIENSKNALDIASAAKYIRHYERKQLKRKEDSDNGIVIQKPLKSKRQLNKDYFDSIKGTEQHEVLKKRKRQNSKVRFDVVEGTEMHEFRKEQMKNYSSELQDSIKGTNAHEFRKEQMKNYSSELQDSIKGTKAHDNKKLKNRKKYHEAKSPGDTAAKRVGRFRNAVNQGPCFICVACNRCHYIRSVVCFKEDKYNLEENIFSLINSFDGKQYICHTCHRKLLKGNVPCQAVWNKLEVCHLPSEFNDLRKLEKAIISRRLLFKKVAIMPKGQMPKVKGSICNVPVDTNEVYNILPRASDSTGIIMVKLKRKLIYNGHVLFEPVRPDAIRRVLQYLKVNNPFYHDIVIDTDNIDPNLLSFQNDDADETNIEVAATLLEERENPLNEHRVAANETALINNIPCQVNDDNIVIAPGQGKQPLSLVNDKNCEELSHPCILPTGKFVYTADREIKLSPVKYFNQRFLNYTQKFASDPDYIFYAHSLLQQLNLQSRINIAMKKVGGNQLNAGMLSQNFKEKVKEFISNEQGYSFMNTIKGTPAYWKRFLQEVLAMVKQLGLPTFFLTLSCADLRWNDLVSIIKKLEGVAMTEEEINSLPYLERCKILNSNPVLVARHFQYRVEVFFKEIIVDGPLGKVKG